MVSTRSLHRRSHQARKNHLGFGFEIFAEAQVVGRFDTKIELLVDCGAELPDAMHGRQQVQGGK